MTEIRENSGSLTAQSAWLMFAKIIGFALSFVLPLVIYRRLSQAEVGIYQQVFLLIATASALLPFGVSMSAYYFLARDAARRPFYVFNILLFNFLVGGLTCLFLTIYPQLLGRFFGDAEMTNFAPQIGLVIWIWVFSSFLEIAPVANGEARLATVFIIFSQLTKMLLMVSAVVFFGTVGALLAAALLQAILQSIVLLGYLNSRFRGFGRSFDRRIFSEQLKYALPFGAAGILWIVQTDAHNYFIGYHFTLEEMAIYRAGVFELPLLGMLSEAVAAVMIPRMSALEERGAKSEMIALSVRASEKLALFYFPAYVFFLITAQTFIVTLFTASFAASASIFLINITLLPFYVLNTDPVVRSFPELGRFLFRIRIVIVALMILTLWFGAQYLDLRAMIVIVVVTALVERFVSLKKVCAALGVKAGDFVLLKRIGKTALAAALAGVPTYLSYLAARHFAPDWSAKVLNAFVFPAPEKLVETVSGLLILSLTGAVFVVFYLLGLRFFSAINEEELEIVKAFFLKLRRRKVRRRSAKAKSAIADSLVK